MSEFDRKKHWENIYETKELEEVSWYQPNPETSLGFIEQMNIPTTAKIIDVGGGDSFLVDHLIDLGFSDISVLDISEAAIQRAQKRLGIKAQKVTWIIADATEFNPVEVYDVWHDRAAFHFLTAENEIAAYLQTASEHIQPQGVMILGTFSENGPTKCSGIPIRQYSESDMVKKLEIYFDKVKCIHVDHTTPMNTVQNFVFCSFKKR